MPSSNFSSLVVIAPPTCVASSLLELNENVPTSPMPGSLALVVPERCLRHVLNQSDAVPSCKIDHGVQVAHMAVEMNRNYGLRARRNYFLDLLGGNETRVLVDVRKYRSGAFVSNSGHRSVVGNRTYDHLIARSDLERTENRVVGGGAVGKSDRVVGSACFGKRRLEIRHHVVGPTAIEYLLD